ncbi:poly(3-hydroxyalkanoate) depolymerase [soil metagenome]
MSTALSRGAVSFVEVDGRPVRVMHLNAGAGNPLVLINGIGAPIEMWQVFIEQVDDRELVLLDLPGCGLSPVPRIPMRMPGIATVVVRVMDALDLKSPDVLGYSFGGVVALELAHRFPDRVRRLVLASTLPGSPSVAPHPAVFAMMLNPLRYYNRRAAELIIPHIAGGRTARDTARMRSDIALRQTHPPSLRGYTYQLLAISTFTSWPWLHRLPHRTMVVHGRADPVSPVLNARLMSATLPNAQLHIVPGAGHLLLLDDPTVVTPAILDFLGSNSDE